MATALVPLKDLVQAKSRLAGLLRPSERRALAQAMVEDVLAVLAQHDRIEQIVLVSDDPGADLLATKYGTDCWTESALGCTGLNAVVGCASERILGDSEEPLLVLHGDLPLLGQADISAALDCQRDLGGLAIGCDQQGLGTNLLAFAAGSIPQFCFGVDSCARHLASAHARQVPVRVLSRPGIALDVDEPADIAELLAAFEPGGSGKTYELLCGSDLGVRLRLALDTMARDSGLQNKDQVQ